MLDSDQEPSYNLSKNQLLLPRILKLIKDMVDDSTPLINQFTYKCRVLSTYKGLRVWGGAMNKSRVLPSFTLDVKTVI